MKRLHVHIFVNDLEKSTRFYNSLFDAQPVMQKQDYARWSLTDPALNFAISTRGKPGIDHLGLQTDDQSELNELFERTHDMDAEIDEQGETSCCYARSIKSWVTDPQGVSWELLHTLHDEETFYGPQDSSACCEQNSCGC